MGQDYSLQERKYIIAQNVIQGFRLAGIWHVVSRTAVGKSGRENTTVEQRVRRDDNIKMYLTEHDVSASNGFIWLSKGCSRSAVNIVINLQSPQKAPSSFTIPSR